MCEGEWAKCASEHTLGVVIRQVYPLPSSTPLRLLQCSSQLHACHFCSLGDGSYWSHRWSLKTHIQKNTTQKPKPKIQSCSRRRQKDKYICKSALHHTFRYISMALRPRARIHRVANIRGCVPRRLWIGQAYQGYRPFDYSTSAWEKEIREEKGRDPWFRVRNPAGQEETKSRW